MLVGSRQMPGMCSSAYSGKEERNTASPYDSADVTREETHREMSLMLRLEIRMTKRNQLRVLVMEFPEDVTQVND